MNECVSRAVAVSSDGRYRTTERSATTDMNVEVM